MKNILDDIVEVKQKEVEQKRKILNVNALKSSFNFTRKCYSLKSNLLNKQYTGIIAEFKKKSPSKGWINKEAIVADVVLAYQNNGAAGISVLTDKTFFGGAIEELSVARTIVKTPLLRKDFVIDDIQIQEAKAHGADVILLIAAILSPERTKQLAIAARNLGLEILLEIHSEEELQHICDEVDMIGVNNRDLKTFQIDIDISLRLAKLIPTDKVKISESGINDVVTIKLLKDHGFNGFLIGENFMKQQNPGEAFKDFAKQLKKEA